MTRNLHSPFALAKGIPTYHIAMNTFIMSIYIVVSNNANMTLFHEKKNLIIVDQKVAHFYRFCSD